MGGQDVRREVGLSAVGQRGEVVVELEVAERAWGGVLGF